jgi:hypothetical protein
MKICALQGTDLCPAGNRAGLAVMEICALQGTGPVPYREQELANLCPAGYRGLLLLFSLTTSLNIYLQYRTPREWRHRVSSPGVMPVGNCLTDVGRSLRPTPIVIKSGEPGAEWQWCRLNGRSSVGG